MFLRHVIISRFISCCARIFKDNPSWGGDHPRDGRRYASFVQHPAVCHPQITFCYQVSTFLVPWGNRLTKPTSKNYGNKGWLWHPFVQFHHFHLSSCSLVLWSEQLIRDVSLRFVLLLIQLVLTSTKIRATDVHLRPGCQLDVSWL